MTGRLEDDLLTHALYDRCENDECPVHHPVSAADVTQRELAFYIGGARDVVDRYAHATNEQLGLEPSSRLPSQRLRHVEAVIREEIERWVLNAPKKVKKPKKRGAITSKGSRVRNTFR
jgi:hypothetical protein